MATYNESSETDGMQVFSPQTASQIRPFRFNKFAVYTRLLCLEIAVLLFAFPLTHSMHFDDVFWFFFLCFPNLITVGANLINFLPLNNIAIVGGGNKLTRNDFMIPFFFFSRSHQISLSQTPTDTRKQNKKKIHNRRSNDTDYDLRSWSNLLLYWLAHPPPTSGCPVPPNSRNVTQRMGWGQLEGESKLNSNTANQSEHHCNALLIKASAACPQSVAECAIRARGTYLALKYINSLSRTEMAMLNEHSGR